MKKELRYPEYIDGIKQVQCPFKRFCIKTWYSEWFRTFFILCPIWLYIIMIVLFLKFPDANNIIRTVCIATYLVLFMAGLIKNDWSELRRIGLDEYHRPLKIKKDD